MTEETMLAIVGAASRLGVQVAGTADVLTRARVQFADIIPTAAELETWLGTLKGTEAPHLFHGAGQETSSPAPTPKDAPEDHGVRLSAAERLTRARGPVLPKPRPPVVTLSAAEVADLAKLSPLARLTQYRALQARTGDGAP